METILTAFQGTTTSLLSFTLRAILLLGVTVLAYLVLTHSKKRDAKEPPVLEPSVPIIGHVLGLAQHGNLYMSKLLETTNFPAFTIDIIFAKYVLVQTASLLASVQRNSRWISFEPLLTPMCERVAGISDKRSLEVLNSKLEPEGHNLMSRSLFAMHPALLGEDLDGMNVRMISYLKHSLNALQNESGAIDIYAWIRNAVTVATTDAVWGDRNPYKDPGVESGIWDWEEGLMYLLPNIMPWLTARKGYLGRERVVAGFREYIKEPPTLESTSALVMSRYNYYMVENDIGAEAYCRVEGSLAFGLLVNSVPTAFWTIYEIYKRPDLLQQLREELTENALHDATESGKHMHVIDLGDIKRKCPHLVSTFQETLRLRMKGSIVRMVMKDTMLDDTYLLKEGSLLQVTAGYFNQSPDHWGTDVKEFHSRRFMELKNTSKARQGFLAFGTSPNTCPGRQFATGEILCLVAMLILRYDIEPVGGKWKEPEINTTSLSAAVMPPKGEIMTKITPRSEFMDCEWDFKLAPGSGRFSLIIG